MCRSSVNVSSGLCLRLYLKAVVAQLLLLFMMQLHLKQTLNPDFSWYFWVLSVLLHFTSGLLLLTSRELHANSLVRRWHYIIYYYKQLKLFKSLESLHFMINILVFSSIYCLWIANTILLSKLIVTWNTEIKAQVFMCSICLSPCLICVLLPRCQWIKF